MGLATGIHVWYARKGTSYGTGGFTLLRLAIDAGQSPMRYREDSPDDLARARAAVAAWRDQHPDGTAEELVIALGFQFHSDYGPVLRAVLHVVDKHHGRVVRGIVTGAAGASR